MLIVAGVVVYLSKKNERAGQIGKIVLGLGVMILALQMVTAATAPLTQASGVRVLFAQLSGDLLLDVLIGALLVVISYSSLAVVLLVATLAATRVVPIEVALPIVLGANLGSGLLALLTTWKADAIARRVPLGNFLFKAAGVVAAVLALPFVTPYLLQLQDDPQQLVVQFHLLFNIVLAIAFIRFTERFASITERWLPAPRATDTVGQPKYLDPVALDTPALALGNAAREAIRLADTVHEMLTGLLTVLKTNDLSLMEALRRKDDEIDRLYSAIKRYLAQVSREALEANEARRWTEIIQFTINLEHIGDIIERLLLDIAQRKIQHKLSFSLRRHERDQRPSFAAGGQSAVGRRRVLERRLEIGAAADRRESRIPRARIALCRPSSSPAVREHAGVGGNELSASRSVVGLQAYQFADLFGVVPDSRIRRRVGKDARDGRAHPACSIQKGRHKRGALVPLTPGRHRAAVHRKGRPHVCGRTGHAAAARFAVGTAG